MLSIAVSTGADFTRHLGYDQRCERRLTSTSAVLPEQVEETSQSVDRMPKPQISLQASVGRGAAGAGHRDQPAP